MKDEITAHEGKEGKQDLWKLILGAAPYSGWTDQSSPMVRKQLFKYD